MDQYLSKAKTGKFLTLLRIEIETFEHRVDNHSSHHAARLLLSRGNKSPRIGDDSEFVVNLMLLKNCMLSPQKLKIPMNTNQ